jgi:small subunit ribosomal protein S21
MQIIVRDNNVDQALRALKKKLQREGVYREMKRHITRSRRKSAPAARRRNSPRIKLERSGSNARAHAKRPGASPPTLSSARQTCRYPVPLRPVAKGTLSSCGSP